MSKEYNSALQEQLRNYISASGISQAKIANKLGISGTQLSQYLNSKYNGDVAKTERDLEEFFRAQQEQQANAEKAVPYCPVPGYVPTSISEDVFKLIRYCQLEKTMVVIYGDAGVGKTKGVERFVRENPASSIYIQATPSTGTLGNLLSVIARALKVPEARKRVDLISAIQEKLEQGNKVLIIDEAQHLQLRALDEIRAWTEPNPMLQRTGVGIALVGNTSIYTRMVGKQEADFSQLFSRIRMRKSCRTEEITREDIQKLFPKLAEAGQKKELDFLHGIARSKWGIRGAVNVYNNAINNEDISHEGLYGMARTMGIGLV